MPRKVPRRWAGKDLSGWSVCVVASKASRRLLGALSVRSTSRHFPVANRATNGLSTRKLQTSHLLSQAEQHSLKKQPTNSLVRCPCRLRDPRRHGCRRGASMDGFTACPASGEGTAHSTDWSFDLQLDVSLGVDQRSFGSPDHAKARAFGRFKIASVDSGVGDSPRQAVPAPDGTDTPAEIRDSGFEICSRRDVFACTGNVSPSPFGHLVPRGEEGAPLGDYSSADYAVTFSRMRLPSARSSASAPTSIFASLSAFCAARRAGHCAIM